MSCSISSLAESISTRSQLQREAPETMNPFSNSRSRSRSARSLGAVCALILIALAFAPARAEAQSACTASTPTQFEPFPPGVSRPASLTPGSAVLSLYHNAAGAPRLMNAEVFGYSVLDISNPASPRALLYDDFRLDPSTATTNTIAQHGDGQSYIATTSVSPDGQRIAFSMNGPASPPWHTLAGRSDGAEGFGMWGDFPPTAAQGTAVQAVGGRYIAYSVEGTDRVTAADITSLPTANADFQALNIPYETTGLPAGYRMSFFGNYLVYVTTSGVLTVYDASNPGPAGSITSAYKSVSIPYLTTDPSHRTAANFTAALDPGDSTKLWILIEVSAAGGEKAPSYGLVAVTRDGNGNLTATASPGLFQVPWQPAETWWNAGNASSLVSLNGVLFVVMWAQRFQPTQQFGFYATTTTTWPTAGPIQVVAAANFNLPALSAASYAAGGTAAYQYFPTGPRAFVIPLTCAPVNPKATSSLTATAYGVAVPNNGSLWIGDYVTVTPTIIPAPAQQPLTGFGWNLDIDFHSGAGVEDAGATPRIKEPDNGVLLGVGQPPNPISFYGPCDPAYLPTPSPGSGAGCWASVLNNNLTGGPDFTGSEAAGTSKPMTIAMEANNQYGTSGTTTFTINWKVPAAKVASTQILSGGAALVSASDGHPAASGFKWYFGPAANNLTQQTSCTTASCASTTYQTAGSYFYWLTTPYNNGFSTPDYNGTTVVGLPFTVSDFVPAFTVNGSASGPVTALITTPPLSVVNNSQRGSGINATYEYSLCTPALSCSDAYVPFGIGDTSGATATIPSPGTVGQYALKFRATYGGGPGTKIVWPASGYFTVNAVNIPVTTATTNAPNNTVTAGNSVTLSCSATGGTGPYNSWAWFSNGQQFSTQQNYTFTATNGGSTDVTLPVACTATDSGGQTSLESAVVTLTIHPSAKPVVNASANPNPVTGGNQVTFSCGVTSGGTPPYSYSWSGTVGGNIPSQNFSFTPSNTSGSPQSQDLTCTVTDSAGQVGTAGVHLVVNSSSSGPPSGGSLTVSASANPNPVQGGQSTVLSCSASGGNGNYSYQWSGSLGNFSNQQNFTFPATNNGSVNQSSLLTCTVTDSSGKSGLANFTLTVAPAGPSCPSVDFKVYASNGTQLQTSSGPLGITIPMSASLGDNLAFTVSGVANQFDWNFGDGSAHKTGPISDPTVTFARHAYTSGGNYTATLRPICSDGTTWGTGMSYPIQVAGPTGQFSAAYQDATPITYTQVTAYKNVVFTAQDSPSLVDAGSYAWDFGDGNTTSGSSTAVHAYEPGTFTARLTVTKNGFPVSTTLAMTVPAPPEPPKWVVPGMAYVNGAVPGTIWQSDVTIMNPSTLAATYSVAFLDASVAPITDYSQLNWTSLSLQPLTSVASSNVLGGFFGKSLGAYGALMVRGDVAPLPPVITARTFNNGDPAKGTFGLSVPQSSVSGGVSAQAAPAASILVGLRQDAAAYTNIGLVNLHNDWATVELDFSDGLTAASLGTLTTQINPYQSVQINKPLQDGRFVPAGGFAGTSLTPESHLYTVRVKILQGTGVYPYATVIDAGTTDPIVVTPTASPSNAYRIPGVVRLTGANGELWRSRVTVSNPSAAGRSVHMVLWYQACNAGGCSNLNSTQGEVAFIPGQTQSWDDFVNVWLTYKGFISVADTTSYANSYLDISPSVGDTNSDPLVVLGETYNATPAGHVGLQIPGYTPLDGVSSTGAYKRLALTGLASTASYRTNVALFVIAGTPGKWANVHVLSAQGTDLRDIPVFVDSTGFTQVGNATLFGGLSGDLSRLSIVIDNIDAGATIGAYATVIDNTSGDSTFVKATPVP